MYGQTLYMRRVALMINFADVQCTVHCTGSLFVFKYTLALDCTDCTVHVVMHVGYTVAAPRASGSAGGGQRRAALHMPHHGEGVLRTGSAG